MTTRPTADAPLFRPFTLGPLALRLARVKAYRPDKRPEEADTMEAVRGIFAAQS